MTPREVRGLRKDDLGLSQVQFAQLLGVHPMTVSKWEREKDALQVPPHQVAMMEAFRRGHKSQKDVGRAAGQALVTAGVMAALFLILLAAFRDE